MMRKEDLMKPDLLSGIVILGSGVVMLGTVVMTVVLALSHTIVVQ